MATSTRKTPTRKPATRRAATTTTITETVTTMDRATVARVQREVDAALTQLGERLGLDVRMERAVFDPEAGTLRQSVTLSVPGAGAVAWARECALVGLLPEHFGATVTLTSGVPATLDGINLRRPKFPVSATTAQGKRFKLTAEWVARQLAGSR